MPAAATVATLVRLVSLARSRLRGAAPAVGGPPATAPLVAGVAVVGGLIVSGIGSPSEITWFSLRA
jgi:hypothetical protein